MKFRLLSDLHLEFGGMEIPPLPEDDSTVLVLAGDIGLADKAHTYEDFIKAASEQFQDVIWICGNHEYYHTSFVRGIPKIQERLKMMDVQNVHFGDRFTVVINGVAYICATMWTDMNGQDPFTMYDMKNRLNDFRLIRNGPSHEPYKRRITTADIVYEFTMAKNFIFDEIQKHMDAGNKTVVVTHHGPSHMSIAPQFARDTVTNGAYVSELGNDIVDAGGPDIWVHGHTHVSLAYEIGNTVVVCNPRGYEGHELNPDFDPEMVLHLD